MARIRMYNMMMQDGTQIIDLEDLREYFDLESVLKYYKNNQLSEWLRSRGYFKQADQINALKPKYKEFEKDFYSALGIEIQDEFDSRSLDQLCRDLELIHSSLSEEGKTIFNIKRNQVARTSEELKTIAENYNTVYLIEGDYSVELTLKDIQYIGIGKEESVINISGRTIYKSDITSLFKHCKLSNKEEYEKTIQLSISQFSQKYIDFLRRNPKGVPLPEGLKTEEEDLNNRGFDLKKIEETARIAVSSPVIRINDTQGNGYKKRRYSGIQVMGGFKNDDKVTVIYEGLSNKAEGVLLSFNTTRHGSENSTERSETRVSASVEFRNEHDLEYSTEAAYMIKGHGITVGKGRMQINDTLGLWDVSIRGIVIEGFFSVDEKVCVLHEDKSTSDAVIKRITNHRDIEVNVARVGDRASLELKSEDPNIYANKILELVKKTEWIEPIELSVEYDFEKV